MYPFKWVCMCVFVCGCVWVCVCLCSSDVGVYDDSIILTMSSALLTWKPSTLLNPIRIGGGVESTHWPEKCVFRPVVDKKSEMKGRKNPSPRPLTPPNTLGFFLYTRTTLKMLVEHQNKAFSCSGFICVNERTKCAKNPNINRVKFHHDLVLTLFVLGGGLNQPYGLKNAFFGRLSTKNLKWKAKKISMDHSWRTSSRIWFYGDFPLCPAFTTEFL